MLVKLIVVLAGLAVSVLALQRPQWALFTLPAVAAFDRPVSAAGLSVQLTTLALVGFAPAFASRWRPACLPTPVALGAAALVAGGVVSCFFAHDPPAAISGALTWALVINAMFGGLGMVAGSPEVLTRLGLEFGGLGALVAVLGWLQGRGVYTVVGPPYVPDRIDSSFGWYSTYGSFVAMATIVAVGTALALVASGRPLLSMFSAGCAVVSGYGTITSLSRGAVLCLGVGCAVLLLSRLRRPSALFSASLAVGLVALLAYLLTPAATVRQLAMRFQDVQGGDELRRILQSAGRTLLIRNPQGIGVGGFRSAAESGTAAVGTEVLYHAHEMYVQIGLDLGWLGLAGFLTLLLYVAISRAVKAWSDRAFSVRIAFIAALSGTAAQGLNDYFFAETGWMILFGIVLLGSLATDPDIARTEPGMSRLRPLAAS